MTLCLIVRRSEPENEAAPQSKYGRYIVLGHMRCNAPCNAGDECFPDAEKGFPFHSPRLSLSLPRPFFPSVRPSATEERSGEKGSSVTARPAAAIGLPADQPSSALPLLPLCTHTHTLSVYTVCVCV